MTCDNNVCESADNDLCIFFSYIKQPMKATDQMLTEWNKRRNCIAIAGIRILNFEFRYPGLFVSTAVSSDA
jgi:hypothetical protein